MWVCLVSRAVLAVLWCDVVQAQKEKEEHKLTEVLASECYSPECKAICGGVFVKQVVLCMCVCVCVSVCRSQVGH